MAGLMLVNFNFNKKYNFDYRTKIFVSLIFLTGAIIFKSALMRSDVNHIKYTSGTLHRFICINMFGFFV